MMNKELHTQVVVIGAGPAGYTAAFRCADLGLNTVLIERYNTLGGVCLNVGCIPSKYLLNISQVINNSKKLSFQGVEFQFPKLDLLKINFEKNKIIDGLTNNLKIMSKKRNIQIIHGKAVFNDKNSIFVNDNNVKYLIYFDYAIIATGSKSIKLSQLPNDDSRIWDSTNALEISMIPKRLLIVGAGIIGLEMGTFYSSIGSNVDIIDSCDKLLPLLDRDIINIFEKSIKKQFNIILNRTILSVENKVNGIFVTMIDKKNVTHTICYDIILVAVGRNPMTHHLNLEKIGIVLDQRGFINVDNQLKTNISNIYAVGDVVGFPMLAHKGIYQASIAAEVISGQKHYFNPRIIPSIAYTYPEIAWVGISELDAQRLKIDYHSANFPWKASGKALASNCSDGMTKLIFDKNTNRIIGGAVIGEHAGELLGEIGLAIEMACDVEDIALTIHAHPTLYESIGLSAKIFSGTITDLLNHNKNK
ncbi:dihydrolipoyl dehydrogenase [Buchnera aphidicola]|uniref:dihydrolipoyl dehydrogenase n=1 Tax=Buchnera aphidicola TaxID=9 RepID=UPI0034646337